MKRRYIPITITITVLAVIAFAGYLRPETRPKVPVRILFDNDRNTVVFSHLLHSRASDNQCIDCHHHSDGDASDPVACELCHPTSYDKNFVAYHQEYLHNPRACVQCHHMEFEGLLFDHAAHEEAVEDCTDCHHGPDREPEPQSCRSCHPPESEGGNVNLRKATHACCKQCHEDEFEEDSMGCFFCHAEDDLKTNQPSYPGCRKCHPVKDCNELIPTKAAAFHKRCMNCHIQKNKGPWAEDECFKCHFE